MPYEAINHFQRALDINPDYDQAHYNLGKRAELNDTINQFQEALRIRPDFVAAQANLAKAQAALRPPPAPQAK